MFSYFDEWQKASSGNLWGVPDGADALALKALADTHGGQAVHVGLDDAGLARMRASLELVGVTEDQILTFPAWDCLPYDRISPNGIITGQRLSCLAALNSAPDAPRFVLTTINAWLQRVPPPSHFQGASLHLAAGGNLSPKDISQFAIQHAYRRADTVREAGEYAIRGSIVDIFPPGAEDPVRVDFFDTEIETIKRFDAETQRSMDKVEAVTLHPVSEFILDEATITAFRGRYRELFGADATRDPLYLSVSEGRHHPGMEQMLPLFHDMLVPFSAYIGRKPVLIDPDVPQAAAQRLAQIDDFFTARREASEDAETELVWRPLPPESLYLSSKEWESRKDARVFHQLSRFSRQEGEAGEGFDLQGRRGTIYHTAATESRLAGEASSISPSRAVAEAAVELARDNIVLLAASTEGARVRMDELIAEHLPARLAIHPVADFLSLEKGKVHSVIWPIEDGFVLPGCVVITEKDIYGSRIARPQGKRRRAENFLREVSSLAVGDFVVHVDHGIGRYEGLEKITTGGIDHDCLLIVYAGGDKLFLPVENIDLLSRYGKEGSDAQLDRLGGASWQARKARIKGRVRDIADQLIKVAALRQTATCEPILPDAGSFAEFCQRFPYAETDDQLDTIGDVMDDLASGRVMDRLICGDVGFGKTEVAMRAAFAVAMAGFQVAVITPTTLLARQHGKTFKDRFQGFPLRIGVLSRMTGSGAATQLRKDIATGDCQIIVGTHALLSKSVSYSNLGLVIVDEEQNFGVTQKERLKSLRGDIHVLTLSATPIPRTLQMALSGVREMSIIATPPVDRLAVRTSVGPWDPVVLAEAIRRERFRGGQVFCVCPRIDHLERVYTRLQTMVPEARIITAHGQMPAADLDEAMTNFGEGGGDVLLSTNIIESGIDIPSANTMIIHRADMFGLSQLYQLRGRVGRSRQRAYAFLTTDPTRLLTPNSRRRLEVMQTLDALGAGFSLASYDLDIRGAGNLLGDEQSGHVREVGVELYQEMLKEAVIAARMGEGDGEPEDKAWSPVINLGAAVLLPDSYVEDLTVRLSLYRRIAALETMEELDQLSAELVDRFGPIPDQARNLLDTITIKILCRMANVVRIDAGPKGLSLSFRNNTFPNPERLIGHIASKAGRLQLAQDHRLVMKQALPLSSRARVIREQLQELVALTV
ncbi:transcription-repair coupling factor [Alphaproteobacteria bacterium LSUCC0684]